VIIVALISGIRRRIIRDEDAAEIYNFLLWILRFNVSEYNIKSWKLWNIL
jgi:hypothetical protein